MAFAEFYMQSGGSNLNAGSDTNNTATYTCANGDWSTVTNIFTPTNGTNPVSAGVTVGQFASVYIDGATVGVYIARVITVVNATNGAITLSSTAKAGSAPTTSATARTIKVGGACIGPQGTVQYPLNLTGLGNLKDASSNWPRFNLKNDQTYSITQVVQPSATGPYVIQGYTSSAGDGGRATIDGSTNAIGIWVDNGANGTLYQDMIFTSSATTGNSNNFFCTGSTTFINCVFTGARNAGLVSANHNMIIECEAYSNNKSNSSGTAESGFSTSASDVHYIRCFSHDNTGSNTSGFSCIANTWYHNCVAAGNGKYGFYIDNTNNPAGHVISHCDAYNNGNDGIHITGSNNNINVYIQNSNLVKNGAYGIRVAATTGQVRVDNCGYGSGTQVNTSGDSNGTITEIGKVTYASGVTPWVAPATGDFRINLAAAEWAGRGAFTETGLGYSGTIGYPDIGAAQANVGSGGTAETSVAFAS